VPATLDRWRWRQLRTTSVNETHYIGYQTGGQRCDKDEKRGPEDPIKSFVGARRVAQGSATRSLSP